jgi:hypothetical protein
VAVDARTRASHDHIAPPFREKHDWDPKALCDFLFSIHPAANCPRPRITANPAWMYIFLKKSTLQAHRGLAPKRATVDRADSYLNLKEPTKQIALP